MPIEVLCPGCSSKLKAPENLIGKNAKCRNCAITFLIPVPVPVAISVGKPQVLSAVGAPAQAALSANDSVLMAAPVEDSDLPVHLRSTPSESDPGSQSGSTVNVAALPSTDVSTRTPLPAKSLLPPIAPKPSAPPSPVTRSVDKPAAKSVSDTPLPPSPSRPTAANAPKKPPVSPTPPAKQTTSPPAAKKSLSLDENETVSNEEALTQTPHPRSPASDNPFSFTSEPTTQDEPKAGSKKKSKSDDDDVTPKSTDKKKQQAEEKEETDPFATSASPTVETVTSENPFSFSSEPRSSARIKSKKQDNHEEADEQVKAKPKQKSESQEEESETPQTEESPSERTASNDPFAFHADSNSSSKEASRSKINKKRKVEEEEESVESEEESQNDEPKVKRGSQRYARSKVQKSNKKIVFVCGILCLLALGVGIAAGMYFTRKESEQAKKTIEKKDEAAPLPPADPPKEEAKSSKKDTPKKDASRKEIGSVLAKDTKMQATAASFPAAMLELPANLKKYEFRPLAAKLELVQQPTETPTQVDIAFEKVKRFFPSPSRVNNDIVVVWQSNPGFNGRGERLAVDTYSGTTGGKVGRFEYDGDGKDVKCDVSADGKLFAAAVDGKVTIWKLADKTKMLEGFDPYADKPTHKKAGLAAVYLPTKSTSVLTVSTAGAMHLFEIATKKQIGEYIPENSVSDRVVQGKNLAVEENRSSVVVAIGGFIHQIKTSNLTVSWKLRLGGDAARSFGLSVVGTPGRIAYAFETDAENKKDRAILFCLPNNQPTLFRWQESAGEPLSVKWSGSECVVVGTTRGVVWFQYDTEGKVFTPVAMAEVPNAKGIQDTTERSHWYLIPSPTDPTKSIMVELTMPIANLFDYLNIAAAKKPLDTLRLNDKGLWK